jgi:2-methylisocitrate lyase-like PEP mutase family enzyme
MAEKKSTRFRNMIDQPGIIVGLCAYDCISARLIEEAGFKVVFHGGYNTAAPLLGMPDVGLITMPETVGYARNMAAAVNIPVICDIDDGFGDIINVIRTTNEVIKSDLAGMYIEDQKFPKKCPALGGNEVVSTDFMLRKLRAANQVRQEEDPDFVLIARTFSGRAINMDEAIKRSIAYAQEGADIIFVDLCYTDEAIDQLKRIAAEIGPHAHVLANMTETVGRPLLTTQELEDMGFKIAYYPIAAMITAAGAVQKMLKELKEKGTTKGLVDKMMPFADIGKLMGIDRIQELEKKFL